MLELLRQRTNPLRKELGKHPIYQSVKTPEALRVFMSYHVWAVWDFMSLAKRLQLVFTCCELPWIPPRRPDLARLVNEIVRDEESDLDHLGRPASHFQSYLAAMDTVKAPTKPIKNFIAMLEAGEDWKGALSRATAPHAAARFVEGNLAIAQDGAPGEVAAAFAFGRELVLPKIFSLFLSCLDESDQLDEEWTPLKFYLQRHVELDGDEHGPAAEQMVVHAVEQDGGDWEPAIDAATRSLEARLLLWDATHQAIVDPSNS